MSVLLTLRFPEISFEPNVYVYVPFDDIQVKSYLNPANIALEIITVGDCNANVTISWGELILTCHCIYPIHTLAYNIGLVRDNIALEIITGGVCLLTLRFPVITCEPNVSVHVPWTLYKFKFIQFRQI